MPSNAQAAQVARRKKTLRHRRSQPHGGLETVRPPLWETEFPMLEPVTSSRAAASIQPGTRGTCFRISVCSTTKDSPIAGADFVISRAMRR